MNNVAFRKRIKWVISGAIHPIVIFNEALLREIAADEIDPSYATKPFPWVFDEDKIGDVYNFVLEENRKHYKTKAHYNRHEREIFWRLFHVSKGTNLPAIEHYGSYNGHIIVTDGKEHGYSSSNCVTDAVKAVIAAFGTEEVVAIPEEESKAPLAGNISSPPG